MVDQDINNKNGSHNIIGVVESSESTPLENVPPLFNI